MTKHEPTSERDTSARAEPFEIDLKFAGTLRIYGVKTHEEALAKAREFKDAFLVLNNRAVDVDGTFAFDAEDPDDDEEIVLSRAFTCYGPWEDEEVGP